MPGGEKLISVGQHTVNSSTDKLTVTSLTQTNSVVTFTVTKSDSTNAAGAEEIHLTFLVGRN
jgi:hypothetical protein